MEERPFREINTRLAGEENPRCLCDLKFQYHVHKSRHWSSYSIYL